MDSLFSIPQLDGIQWVSGAGQPSAAHWVPVLKRIQQAGKLIHIDIIPEDLPILLESLEPEGVLYTVWCETPDECDRLVKMAANARGKKIF